MTLDELINVLQALRAQYPSAGSAHVNSAVDLAAPTYDQGEVQLGLEFVVELDDLDDDDEHPPAVH